MADTPHGAEPTPVEIDAMLVRAWRLFVEDQTDEVIDALEPLIAPLERAGYAEVAGYAWGFTAAGIARAEELDPDEDQPTQQTQPKGIDPKTGKSYEPVEIPVPKERDIEDLISRSAKRPKDAA